MIKKPFFSPDDLLLCEKNASCPRSICRQMRRRRLDWTLRRKKRYIFSEMTTLTIDYYTRWDIVVFAIFLYFSTIWLESSLLLLVLPIDRWTLTHRCEAPRGFYARKNTRCMFQSTKLLHQLTNRENGIFRKLSGGSSTSHHPSTGHQWPFVFWFPIAELVGVGYSTLLSTVVCSTTVAAYLGTYIIPPSLNNNIKVWYRAVASQPL